MMQRIHIPLPDDRTLIYQSDHGAKMVQLSFNRRLIYQSDLTAVSFDLLYDAGHVVDGMCLDDGSRYLYWTTYDSGSVVRLDLANHTLSELVTGLDSPRAIVIDDKLRCVSVYLVMLFSCHGSIQKLVRVLCKSVSEVMSGL